MLEGQASAVLLVLMPRQTRWHVAQGWPVAYLLAVGVVLILPKSDTSLEPVTVKQTHSLCIFMAFLLDQIVRVFTGLELR